MDIHKRIFSFLFLEYSAVYVHPPTASPVFIASFSLIPRLLHLPSFLFLSPQSIPFLSYTHSNRFTHIVCRDRTQDRFLIAMKFSKILSDLIEQMLPDWRDQFLSYRDLKKQLRLIYPKDPEPSTSGGGRPGKRPKLKDGGGLSEAGRGEETELAVTKEVIDFVRLLEDEIDKFNAFFVDKEEEYIIRLKVLQDRVAEVQESNEELMTVGREIVDLHGEMVLLLNYSALNYTGLVKIMKKYDKRSGALIRLPFIQKVLQEPFFTTDVLNKLVKDCETMLDQFFSMNQRFATYQAAAERKEELNDMTGTINEDRLRKVPEELAEIQNIKSMYMKQTIKALEVFFKIRSGSSTVSVFSLPPLKWNESEAEWRKIIAIEQAAK